MYGLGVAFLKLNQVLEQHIKLLQFSGRYCSCISTRLHLPRDVYFPEGSSSAWRRIRILILFKWDISLEVEPFWGIQGPVDQTIEWTVFQLTDLLV